MPVADVQCDEIWAYARKKQSRRVLGDKDYHYIGDAWVFIGIERNSKLVLTFEVGQRTVNQRVQIHGELGERYQREPSLSTQHGRIQTLQLRGGN
jgi:hypothetical protein